MVQLVGSLIVLLNLIIHCMSLWDQDMNCPLICTCRLEHLTETAIKRFMARPDQSTPIDTESIENNEVLYEEKEEDIELLEQHTSPIVRSATCILQTETDPYELLENLPKNIESLTLIQGYESGNKSVKFSYLNAFLQLIILELVGPNIKHNSIESHLICEIDTPISDLRYLNLERVLIKNSKQQMINVLKKITQEELTFEYIQKVSSTLHSLTMLQRGGIDEDIVPYEVFKQQQDTNRDVPLFVGFKKLFLLRITDCDLNGIHWEMFDGLNTLRYLILDRNNIKFIPPFTFYGTPNLKDLSLAHNKLLDIQITDLAGLLELEYLDLSYNNFTQLSELSLPPFPKLKLANFANNPIGVIFPSTFEVMNTTNSLIIGSDYMPLTLITNSLLGLSLLEKLTINNLKLKLLKRDMFFGMPHLKELVITGNITDIEYDAFLEINRIEKLQLSRCQVQNISMDAFIGLVKLQYLDLSENSLEFLPPGVFDHLTNIKEIYLNANKFQTLPRDIFSRIHPKLIRLNDNPWECSCEMSEWKPMIVNKIKQKISKPCNFASNKGPSCATGQNWQFKYLYENKVAPKCAKPQEFINWNIFHAMRRILKCPGYKPKLRKHINFKHLDNTVKEETTENLLTTGSPKLEFNVTLKNAAQPYTSLEDLHFNDIKHINYKSFNNNLLSKSDKLHVKYRKSYLKKYPKKISYINNSIFNS